MRHPDRIEIFKPHLAGIAAGLLAIGLPGCQKSSTPAPLPAIDVVNVPVTPPQIGARRLTVAQYHNAVADVFGADIVLARAVEPDIAVESLQSIGAARTAISPWGVEQYEKLAFDIAAQTVGDPDRRARFVPCTPVATVDAACARKTLAPLGGRLWRRPMTGAELATAPADTTTAVEIAGTAAEALGDFYKGLEFGVAFLLQSPHFLYVVESGEPDPNHDGLLRYTSVEMASRLSFFFWNTIPDDALLAAAGRGELADTAKLTKIADEMLADPRARQGVRAFFTDLLKLYKLDALSKDPNLFEHFSDDLGPSAREGTLRDIEALILTENGDYRTLLTRRKTFVNPRLAAVYEVPLPKVSEEFQEVELPAWSTRQGLLGQVSMLAVNAHPTSSSATLRGRYVRETLLCGEIPPPLSNVNTAIPEPSPDSPTLRDRVAIHLSVEMCASCHSAMDPIGLGLENFDSVGRYRRTENDVLIDTTGILDGMPFRDAAELSEAVAQHPDLGACFVRNLVRYATGRIEERGQRQAIEALRQSFDRGGYRIRELMRNTVLSPVFRKASPPQMVAAGTTETTGDTTGVTP